MLFILLKRVLKLLFYININFLYMLSFIHNFVLNRVRFSCTAGTYIAVVVKTITVTQSYKLLYSHLYSNPLHFHCPWALTIGGVGGILVLVSAVAHLCILSRNKANDDVHVYHIHRGTNQGIFSQHPYTTIAPPGYTAAVGLKIPLVNAIEANEGAGPLPEKKWIFFHHCFRRENSSCAFVSNCWIPDLLRNDHCRLLIF